MTLINDDKIEEIRLESTEWLLVFVTSQLLIEGQIQFIGAVQLFPFNFRHNLCKRLKVLLHGLINKNITVSKEEYLFLSPGFPEPMNNLKCRIGLTGTGRHNEQDTILPMGDGIYGTVDGNTLIVARSFVARLEIIRFSDEFLLLRCKMLVPNVSLPQILR